MENFPPCVSFNLLSPRQRREVNPGPSCQKLSLESTFDAVHEFIINKSIIYQQISYYCQCDWISEQIFFFLLPCWFVSSLSAAAEGKKFRAFVFYLPFSSLSVSERRRGSESWGGGTAQKPFSIRRNFTDEARISSQINLIFFFRCLLTEDEDTKSLSVALLCWLFFVTSCEKEQTCPMVEKGCSARGED